MLWLVYGGVNFNNLLLGLYLKSEFTNNYSCHINVVNFNHIMYKSNNEYFLLKCGVKWKYPIKYLRIVFVLLTLLYGWLLTAIDIPFLGGDRGLFPGTGPTGSWAPLCERRAPGRPSGCHSWSRDTQLSL